MDVPETVAHQRAEEGQDVTGRHVNGAESFLGTAVPIVHGREVNDRKVLRTNKTVLRRLSVEHCSATSVRYLIPDDIRRAVESGQLTAPDFDDDAYALSALNWAATNKPKTAA